MSSNHGVRRSGSGRWLRVVAALAPTLLVLAPAAARAQAPAGGAAVVRVVGNADSGLKLQVDGRDFMVLGMNWDYFPVGTNYAYSLWTQPDDVIEAALAREMPLLKRLGANTIRAYVGIQPRWVRYIYERYGIYTVLNHTVGRYGYELDGAWIAQVDYASPRFRAAVTAEIVAMVEQYRDVPGMLMWMLGNENRLELLLEPEVAVEARGLGEVDEHVHVARIGRFVARHGSEHRQPAHRVAAPKLGEPGTMQGQGVFAAHDRSRVASSIDRGAAGGPCRGR